MSLEQVRQDAMELKVRQAAMALKVRQATMALTGDTGPTAARHLAAWLAVHECRVSESLEPHSRRSVARHAALSAALPWRSGGAAQVSSFVQAV